MRQAKIIGGSTLSCVPNQDPGSRPVICVLTDLPPGQKNSFYMEIADLEGVPIILPMANLPIGTPLVAGEFNLGDDITFDIQDGFHKAVLWNGRKIRQRDYSFDQFSQFRSLVGFGTKFDHDGWSATR